MFTMNDIIEYLNGEKTTAKKMIKIYIENHETFYELNRRIELHEINDLIRLANYYDTPALFVGAINERANVAHDACNRAAVYGDIKTAFKNNTAARVLKAIYNDLKLEV